MSSGKQATVGGKMSGTPEDTKKTPEGEKKGIEMPPDTLSRAEKKRDREKRRRSDLNLGFENLTDLIFRIEPSRQRQAEMSAKTCKGKNDESPLLSRVDIIHQALEVMERLYLENEERKRIIQHLSQGLLAGPDPSVDPLAPSRFAAVRELEVRSFATLHVYMLSVPK